MSISRRNALRALAGTGVAGAAVLIAAKLKFDPLTPLQYSLPDVQPLAPTPACADLHDHTPNVTEGPFYKPATPERWMLRDAKTAGRPLLIEGRVLTPDCRPVAGAVLDVWSCDGNGVYDNDGFGLRGHQFTDAGGAFRIATVKPKDYRQWGMHRTAHIHVKLQGRGTRLLTTQLFFPGEPQNEHDWFFKSALLLDVAPADDGPLVGKFDFVL
jgi:protocatechuate 3,4-dioxygenase beta subunit